MGLLLSVLVSCVGVLELVAFYTDFWFGVTYAEYRTNVRDIARGYAVQLQKYRYLFDDEVEDSRDTGDKQLTTKIPAATCNKAIDSDPTNSGLTHLVTTSDLQDVENNPDLLYTPGLRRHRSKSPSPFSIKHFNQTATYKYLPASTEDSNKTVANSSGHISSHSMEKQYIEYAKSESFVEKLPSEITIGHEGTMEIKPDANVQDVPEDASPEIMFDVPQESSESLRELHTDNVKHFHSESAPTCGTPIPVTFTSSHSNEMKSFEIENACVECLADIADGDRRSASPFNRGHFKGTADMEKSYDYPTTALPRVDEPLAITRARSSTPSSDRHYEATDAAVVVALEKEKTNAEQKSTEPSILIDEPPLSDHEVEQCQSSSKKKRRRKKRKTCSETSEGDLLTQESTAMETEVNQEQTSECTVKRENSTKRRRKRNKTPGPQDESNAEQPAEHVESGELLYQAVERRPSPYPESLFRLSATDDPEPFMDEQFLRTLDGVRQPRLEDKRRSFRKKRNSSSSSRASKEDTRSSLDEDDTRRQHESWPSPFTSVQETEQECAEGSGACGTSEDSKIEEDSLNSSACSAVSFDADARQEAAYKSTEPDTTDQRQRFRDVQASSFEDASATQNVHMKRRLSGSLEDKPLPVQQVLGEAFWLIFSAEYTNAMEKDWHGQHFSCWQCDESLTGQRYVLRDEHPYCVKCYEQVFANTCEKCSRIIGIDSKDLSYKEKHWHEACFQCTTCGDSLVDKQFGAKGEKIYCGRCYDNQFASRCDGCGNIFHAGTKKMEYKNRQWHEACFCCCTCKTPIGTKSFIPREKDIYCAQCYEEKFATRCIKCNKAIQSGGVTYKNEPWHRECFTCTHCNKNLAGQRFTSRDDKPCCADCFGKLFAKRCTACTEPITGIGGTRFISFEDRHWHNDCFICASCSESLVGRGFITDNDKIICPECAKQRFM